MVEETGYDGWVAGEYYAAGERRVMISQMSYVHSLTHTHTNYFQVSLRRDLIGQNRHSSHIAVTMVYNG